MDAQTAQEYSMPQVNTFEVAGADMVNAMPMTYAEEAIGIAWAAQIAGMPVVISFAIESNGNLPSGQSLKRAIEQVDQATSNTPSYYMIDCAHPAYLQSRLPINESWTDRIYGIVGNISCSNTHLDTTKNTENIHLKSFGTECLALTRKLRNLTVLGGCCDHNHRHIEAICEAYCPQVSPLVA